MEHAITDRKIVMTDTEMVIYERRAVRKYKDIPVERALVEQLLEAGRMAPSAMNSQPWRFYILTDKETITAFSKAIAEIAFKDILHSGRTGIRQVKKIVGGLLSFSHGIDLHRLKDPVFYGAPVVIFVTAPRDNDWAPLDIGMCSQNIMLAAKSHGLDSCPVGFGKYVEKTRIFPRLQIPPAEQVQLAIILGYGDETPEVHKRLQNNILFID